MKDHNIIKTYKELSDKQKEDVESKFFGEILSAILNGVLIFNDEANNDNLQATIDAAIDKANSMKTPWFANEYVLEAEYTVLDSNKVLLVDSLIRSLAHSKAIDALYTESRIIVTVEPD